MWKVSKVHLFIKNIERFITFLIFITEIEIEALMPAWQNLLFVEKIRKKFAYVVVLHSELEMWTKRFYQRDFYIDWDYEIILENFKVNDEKCAIPP